MSKQFEALLETLKGVGTEAEDLNKSLPAAEDAPGATDGEDNPEDDETIAAAAAEAEKAKGDGEGEPFGKSMTATDADGNQVEAVDATELVKSILARQDSTEANLTKAIETLTSVAQKQGELIKSLTAKVSEMSTQGRGRKSQLVVVEKPDTTLAKSEGGEPKGLSIEDFMLKADLAFRAKKISGQDLTVIDVCRRSNQAIDPALVNKVIHASA